MTADPTPDQMATTTSPPPVMWNPAAHTTSPRVAHGDLVLYQLSDHDVSLINGNDPAASRRNPVLPGQLYPALVVAVFTLDTVNLRVWLDGAGDGAEYWATSRHHGDQPGEWVFRVA